MKKYILLTVVLLVSLSSFALGQKQTYLYAVKGADSLYLDHYVSSKEAMRPCMIFVFGGGFVRGERDNEGYLPYFEYLNDNGYDVVSIDYRLGLKDLATSGVGSMRDMIGKLNNTVNIAVEDLFSATAFVLDNAREWGIDRDMIVTCGSSAGAITVLQAENALCNRKREATLLPEGFRYAGVISFAGAIFSLDGAPKWREKPAPVLMFHGSADTQGAVRQQPQYTAGKIQKKCESFLYPGRPIRKGIGDLPAQQRTQTFGPGVQMTGGFGI